VLEKYTKAVNMSTKAKDWIREKKEDEKHVEDVGGINNYL